MDENIRLLIVDDEERFLKTLTERLEMRGFDVTAVNNGADAIRIAAARAFDLALVDLKMPGMGGERVLELLKQNDPHIEVVILTGHGSIDSAVECTQLGSFSYLQKPCATDELLQVLKNAYQKRVQHKLDLDEQRMGELLGASGGESALGVLRRLRAIERGGEENT
jgi:two-component system NtrC family response regulator